MIRVRYVWMLAAFEFKTLDSTCPFSILYRRLYALLSMLCSIAFGIFKLTPSGFMNRNLTRYDEFELTRSRSNNGVKVHV